MDPALFAFDALYYASKKCPTVVNDKWSISAAIAPANTREACLSLPPSGESALLQFTSNDLMRLQLPVKPARITVEAVHEAWQKALLACTPAASEGLLVPISPVEHENEQLKWGRKNVPLCRFGSECDACLLENAPGPLHAYLSVQEQDVLDATGQAPKAALFCLLCIRRDCQALYLAHRAINGGKLNPGTNTLCVPPFQNLVDVPGGYVSTALSVPISESGDVPISIVGVSSKLAVMQNPYTNEMCVDQGNIVYGAQLN